MAKRKDLVKVAEEKGALAFLREAIKNIDAILTGTLGTEKLQLMMIPGRLFQAARNHKFLNQFAKEAEELRNKGEIKDDYLNTEQASATLQELLAALEEPPVDEVKFHTLKAIFIKAAKEKLSDRNDPTPQLLMNVARNLSSGEILLLAEIYKIGNEGVSTKAEIDANAWVREIANRSVMSSIALVEFYEESLIEKKLVTPRKHSDKSGADRGQLFRLTDLGFKLCQFFLED